MWRKHVVTNVKSSNVPAGQYLTFKYAWFKLIWCKQTE